MRLILYPLLICPVIVLSLFQQTNAVCSGSFPNIITDVCWECVFPIRVGGMNITPSYDDGDNEGDGNPICICPSRILGNTHVPGIKISLWEPVRMADVTRTPYCLVNMGGMHLGNSNTLKDRGVGALPQGEGTLHKSYYHVHWYVFPIFYAFELLLDFACVDQSQIDLLHLSEFDPFWDNDELALLHNPEAVLFGNPIAQAACAVDCAKASFGHGFDAMFWCAGCFGSLYPFTGSVAATVTSVQATELLVARFMAKMHRYGLMYAYIGPGSECKKQFAPIIKKSMYRLQMINPIPATDNACMPIGKSDFWHGRHQTREILQGSNNYGYLIWRKRQCCLF